MFRAVVVNFFSWLGGGRGLFHPRGQYVQRAPERIVVLTPAMGPTTDLYLRGRLQRQFGLDVRYVDTKIAAPAEIALGDNTMVVIVRQAPKVWLSWLEEQGRRLTGVVFLMDDDLPAAAMASELPWRYAMRTAWSYARSRRLLGRLCSEIWVSTEELARRYNGSAPILWEPGYVGCMPATHAVPLVYFYHGTWAHRREIEWLVPIVRQVQQEVPAAWFEIIGTDRVKRLFRGIPRVRIIHPMPWQDYLAYTTTVRFQVGLAPCFDTSFNRARSHCKLFDITRLGAAGIYSDATPYTAKIVHGKTGLLCANDQDTWVAAITELLADLELQTSLYQSARESCEKQAVALAMIEN